MPGTLFVVATPIGNLDDVSPRAVRVLGEVALIAAEDTRRTAHLLARFGIKTPTTSLHAHNEHRKLPVVLERLARGDDVALVSDAGAPTVSDPGHELVRAARQAGARVVPIPGPSAVTTVLMASGYAAQPVHFYGFPPNRGNDRTWWFERLASTPGTAVFFEAPHRIARTLADLKHSLGDTRVLLGREMTKKHEEFVEGPISEVVPRAERAIGEYTIAVEIGGTTETVRPKPPAGRDLAAEFGRMIDDEAVERRTALLSLAKKYGLSRREVYRAIEEAKKFGK